MNRLLTFFLAFVTLAGMGSAQDNRLQTHKVLGVSFSGEPHNPVLSYVTASSSAKAVQAAKASIRIESAELCPGETADLGVYVDLQSLPGKDSPDPLSNFMFYLFVTDTSRLEVVTHDSYTRPDGTVHGLPVLTDFDEGFITRGSTSYNYILNNSGPEMEGHAGCGLFAFIWVDASVDQTSYIPHPAKPIFRIRVRCKDQGPSRLEFSEPSLAFSTGLSFMGGYFYDFTDQIHNAEITNAQGPDKSTISAGEDTYMCVGERAVFNAEGGVGYRWSQAYNINIPGGYQNEYLTNRNTKNPTFWPQKSGPFIYQVAVYNEKGCYTLDTVNYYVSQNYIRNSITPAQVLLDSGGVAVFTASGSTSSQPSNNLYPLTVTFTPDSIFPQGQNQVVLTATQKTQTIATLPMSQPALVVAEYADKYCSAQSASRVYVKGVKLTGYIAPFPVFRCGNDTKDKSIELNLLTQGGSGNFLFNWRVTDLEFGEQGAPYLSNPSIRNPKLWYVGRCAVSVDVFDMETGEMVTFSDTMQYKDWVTPKAEIRLDPELTGLEPGQEGAPFCENMMLTYHARTQHAGDNPLYVWRINGAEVFKGGDSTFSYYFHKGDSVDVVLYSSDACATEAAVAAPALTPYIEYPSILSVFLSNVSEGESLKPCHSGFDLKLDYFNAGHNFLVSWYRNQDLIDSEWVHTDQSSGSITRTFERENYFDSYFATVSQTDMPCSTFDSIASASIYINSASSSSDYVDPEEGFQPIRKLQPQDIFTDTELVCEGDQVVLHTRVNYLPREFVLMWYRKNGADSSLLGYYAYNNGSDPLTTQQPLIQASANLTSGYPIGMYDLTSPMVGYGYGSSSQSMRQVVADGFKLVLNDAESVVDRNVGPDDTVFYWVYATTARCNLDAHAARSSYFVPRQLSEIDVTDEFSFQFLEDGEVCSFSPLTLVVKGTGELDPSSVSYTWIVNGKRLDDTTNTHAAYYSVLGSRGDTLSIHKALPTTKIQCIVETSRACVKGLPVTLEQSLAEKVLPTVPFYIHTNPDTIVCEGASVQNRAEVREYTASLEWKDASQKYRYAWAFSLDDLHQGRYLVEGQVFEHTPVSNGNQPQGIGDITDTKGVTTYYVKAWAQNGCEAYDSVRVLMAHPYQVEARLQPLVNGPWCDSLDMEGKPVQRLDLKMTNAGTQPLITWMVNGVVVDNPESDTTVSLYGIHDSTRIEVRVRTSMLTCLPDQVTTPVYVAQVSRPGKLYTHAPDWARVGDTVLLQAAVGSEQQIQEGRSFTWFGLDPDNRWEKLKETPHRPGNMVDSLVTVIPTQRSVYRVLTADKYDACPALEAVIPIVRAVPTGVTIKAYDEQGNEVSDICAMENAFAKGVGKTENISWIGTDGRSPLRVKLVLHVENPRGKAYAGFYKKGTLIGVGPVGTDTDIDWMDAGETDYEHLQRGDTMWTEVLPGDWVGGFYVHDTVSDDMLNTHYSDKISFDSVAPDGIFEAKAQPSAICRGDEVKLMAAFSSLIPDAASLTWQSSTPVVLSPDGTHYVSYPQSDTYFVAQAYDSYQCAWSDTVHVSMVEEDGDPLELTIKADSLRFCGEKAMMKIYAPEVVSGSDGFKQLYWYLVRDGETRLADSGLAPVYLEVKGQDRVYAVGISDLDCAASRSYSDTLTFVAVDYPQLIRLAPVGDVETCRGSHVRLSYSVFPDDVAFNWWGTGNDTCTRLYQEVQIWSNSQMGMKLRYEQKPYCMVSDTLDVKVKSYQVVRPSVSLSLDRTYVCGPETVHASAVAENCDSLLWYYNDSLVSRSGSTYTFVPELTGVEGPGDTLRVVGVFLGDECNPSSRDTSSPVLVYRVDKPEIRLCFEDTVVDEGSTLRLFASCSYFDGQTPLMAWFNSQDEKLAQASEVVLQMQTSEWFRVSARQEELGDFLPECVQHDTVRVSVVEIPDVGPDDTVQQMRDFYIPNTLIMNSPEPDNRVFKVYGPDVASVVMKIFDAKGTLIFQRSGENVVWTAKDMLGSDVESGNYSYWVRVILSDGSQSERKGMISVIR